MEKEVAWVYWSANYPVSASVALHSCCFSVLQDAAAVRTMLVQGYVEGEYVYVASPLAGALGTLSVRRGAQVKEGDSLFALDSEPERTARDEAVRKLDQARSNLEDARKGKRPSEIDSMEAS